MRRHPGARVIGYLRRREVRLVAKPPVRRIACLPRIPDPRIDFPEYFLHPTWAVNTAIRADSFCGNPMRIRMRRHPTPHASLFTASSLRRTWLAVLLLSCWWWPAEAQAAEALVLARDTLIRLTPHASGRVIKTAQPGETYEIPGRRTGKGQPLYVMDERGGLWVKVRINAEESGFVRTDLVSVAREEYRPVRGTTLLIVNLRPTADGGVSRELWVAQDGWQWTRWLATIEGRPIWASHGEWFICQVDSERPIKDQSIDRTVERIARFSADGRVRTMLAAGSNPLLHETRGEVFFYRDLDDQGDAVPPGLFAVHVDGHSLRPVYLLPERYRFWKEDGDYFVQAPPPIFSATGNRISLHAFETMGTRVRITVSLDGQFLELRRE